MHMRHIARVLCLCALLALLVAGRKQIEFVGASQSSQSQMQSRSQSISHSISHTTHRTSPNQPQPERVYTRLAAGTALQLPLPTTSTSTSVSPSGQSSKIAQQISLSVSVSSPSNAADQQPEEQHHENNKREQESATARAIKQNKLLVGKALLKKLASAVDPLAGAESAPAASSTGSITTSAATTTPSSRMLAAFSQPQPAQQQLASPTATSFQCPEQFGYYTDAGDCAKYFVCVFGEMLHESCTGGLHFSKELQTCDWPRNVQCQAVAVTANQHSSQQQQQSKAALNNVAAASELQQLRPTTNNEQNNSNDKDLRDTRDDNSSDESNGGGSGDIGGDVGGGDDERDSERDERESVSNETNGGQQKPVGGQTAASASPPQPLQSGISGNSGEQPADEQDSGVDSHNQNQSLNQSQQDNANQNQYRDNSAGQQNKRRQQEQATVSRQDVADSTLEQANHGVDDRGAAGTSYDDGHTSGAGSEQAEAVNADPSAQADKAPARRANSLDGSGSPHGDHDHAIKRLPANVTATTAAPPKQRPQPVQKPSQKPGSSATVIRPHPTGDPRDDHPPANNQYRAVTPPQRQQLQATLADSAADPQQPAFDEAVAPVMTPNGDIHVHDGPGGTFGLLPAHGASHTHFHDSGGSSRDDGHNPTNVDVFVRPVPANQRPRLVASFSTNGATGAGPKPISVGGGRQRAVTASPPPFASSQPTTTLLDAGANDDDDGGGIIGDGDEEQGGNPVEGQPTPGYVPPVPLPASRAQAPQKTLPAQSFRPTLVASAAARTVAPFRPVEHHNAHPQMMQQQNAARNASRGRPQLIAESGESGDGRFPSADFAVAQPGRSVFFAPPAPAQVGSNEAASTSESPPPPSVTAATRRARPPKRHQIPLGFEVSQPAPPSQLWQSNQASSGPQQTFVAAGERNQWPAHVSTPPLSFDQRDAITSPQHNGGGSTPTRRLTAAVTLPQRNAPEPPLPPPSPPPSTQTLPPATSPPTRATPTTDSFAGTLLTATESGTNSGGVELDAGEPFGAVDYETDSTDRRAAPTAATPPSSTTIVHDEQPNSSANSGGAEQNDDRVSLSNGQPQQQQPPASTAGVNINVSRGRQQQSSSSTSSTRPSKPTINFNPAPPKAAPTPSRRQPAAAVTVAQQQPQATGGRQRPTTSVSSSSSSTTTTTPSFPQSTANTKPPLLGANNKPRPRAKKISVDHEQALANNRASTEPAKRPEPVFATPHANQQATKCDNRACRLPDCKCGDSLVPNQLDPKVIPQVVLLTFDDAVNDLNWEIYEELFTGRTNPNGCPVLATFYVSHEWTDYGQVQTLYSRGHEMASHSVTHSFGEKFSKSQWFKEINGQREILNLYGGVKINDVRGMRAPFLQIGGNKMFEMLYDANFTYDSSMPIFENSPPLWPYTLDYQLSHECMITPCPTKSYPGVWEVGMTMWVDLRGGRCSMGDACSNPADEDGVYEMLMKNFNRHYKSNRAPFGLFYHSAWFNTVHHRRGFIRFMETINSLPEVFFVTNWQMIQWMRQPTPLADINSFEPWQCPTRTDRPAPCFHPSVCNVKSEHGTRFMKTCQPCPANQQYPWVGSTGFKPVNNKDTTAG